MGGLVSPPLSTLLRISCHVTPTPRRVVGTVLNSARAMEAAGMRVGTGAAVLAAGRMTAAAKAGMSVAAKAGRLSLTPAAAATAVAAGSSFMRVDVPAAARTDAATIPAVRRGHELVTAIPQHVTWVGRALLDLHPRRQRRQVWAEHGHAHIDVRGIDGDGRATLGLAGRATAAVGHLRGVRWAKINAVTGQMLVAYDEGRVDVETLLGAIRKVEDAYGTREEGFSWARPAHPGDGAPIAAATAELAADCVAVMAAGAEKVFGLPSVPSWVRLPLAVAELSEGVRQRLTHRIGPFETEFALTLANAAVYGLSAGLFAPAVDALYRSLLLAETWSRREVWKRREPELCSDTACVPSEAPDRSPGPRPRPYGPVEKWSHAAGVAAPGMAAAVLALTRSPGRTGDAVLAMVPKAAAYGREGFAAVTGWRLARRGILPLNPGAFRRLDQVSAIVVDSATLCADRPQVLTAEAELGTEQAEVCRVARAVLGGRSLGDLAGAGPWQRGEGRLARQEGSRPPSVLDLAVSERDRRLGRVTVGGELLPVAEAVLDVARATGAGLFLTDEPSVAELFPLADEVLGARGGLAAHVRRLQEEGQVVLVVSEFDCTALSAADVGVAVPASGRSECWSADLVCRADAGDVFSILRAVAAARPVSERGVRLAQAGSALGVLLALLGHRRWGRLRAVTPVYLAAFMALVWGAAAGLRATTHRTQA
ncbi:MAG: hypothetical protein ACJ72W_03030 [Actinoallomurus sp.]